MNDKNAWLARSNAELAEGWREAWWIEARAHLKPDREQRRLVDESDAARLAVLELVGRDPARALEVGFLIARSADHAGMLLNVGVSILQELLKRDATLWDAIDAETVANPALLGAVARIWEVEVPEVLAYRIEEANAPRRVQADDRPCPPATLG